MIRTPDQRVRIFVSSSLHELAPERQAVRDAVTRLRLVPVMFELSARPYPARQVYRDYLAQSQVFVGIYWQSYGSVAPGEEISALDDGYRLPATLAKRARQTVRHMGKQAEPGRVDRGTGLVSVRGEGSPAPRPCPAIRASNGKGWPSHG
jgi:hypothetical protein